MVDKSIDISAIICSCDRYDHLTKAVQSLMEQETSDLRFEIIIIDNSTRPDVNYEESLPSVPEIRFFRIPNKGLSNARNEGLKRASGKYLAFLDDDARADKYWLQKITDFFDNNPSVGVLGGKIIPDWEVAPPAWLMGPLYGASDDRLFNKENTLIGNLTIANWGDAIKTLDAGEWVAGANMSIRAQCLSDFDGFDENLGRKGEAYVLLGNEEAAAIQHCEAKGFTTIYHPEIVVYHFIPEQRISQDWICQRVMWQIMSDVMEGKLKPDTADRERSLNILKNIKSPANWFAKAETLEEYREKIAAIAAVLKLSLLGRPDDF